LLTFFVSIWLPPAVAPYLTPSREILTHTRLFISQGFLKGICTIHGGFWLKK
jgi:hypothetical protein